MLHLMHRLFDRRKKNEPVNNERRRSSDGRHAEQRLAESIDNLTTVVLRAQEKCNK